MTTAPRDLPLTFNGRSPFDDVRIRWGGFGSVVIGTALLFGGASGDPGGIVIGIPLILLGLATWILSGFGSRYWYDIPTPQRYVVGTGAIVGMLMFIVFIVALLLISWIMSMFASTFRN